MTPFLYDETNPNSIEEYSQKLIGRTFNDIYNTDRKYAQFINEEIEELDYAARHEDKRRKGGLGELIEECFFHYKCNSESKPDFDKAGVELKVTPYKKLSNGKLSSKERLSITMIDYCNDYKYSFYDSHLWEKSRLILLIYYLYQEQIEDRLDYEIHYSKLFSPPKDDLEIIIHDYETIINKIKSGKAHELSEGDTLYLGAATKASSSTDRKVQPNSDILAKPRAYSFKNSYMTYVLNTYIVPGKLTYEPILTEPVKDFEIFVENCISKYKGWSIDDLCNEFDISFSKRPKNLESTLAFRILGIKSNNAEEFVKANVIVKTIRISKNNTIKESMSFPSFKFKELVEETWDESTFGTYLSESRFLFIVYKFDENDVLRLCGAQFWNIPFDDLQIEVNSVWEKTVDVLKKGLQIAIKNGKNRTNLPKASENRVCHVRPHALNANDTFELPTGGFFPKQCFWLNNTYIRSQLNKDFFN